MAETLSTETAITVGTYVVSPKIYNSTIAQLLLDNAPAACGYSYTGTWIDAITEYEGGTDNFLTGIISADTLAIDPTETILDGLLFRRRIMICHEIAELILSTHGVHGVTLSMYLTDINRHIDFITKI